MAPEAEGSHSKFPEIEGRLQMRALSMTELITRTLDDIRYLKKIGEKTGPLVDYLRRIVTGIEDKEFWDGLPDHVREEVKKLEESKERGDMARARRLRKQFLAYGWNGISIRARRSPSGPRYIPTEADSDQMLAILLRLLARRKATWKVRASSPLPDVEEDYELG